MTGQVIGQVNGHMNGQTMGQIRTPAPRTLSPLIMLLAAFPFLAGFDPVRSRSATVEEGNARMKAGKADEALAAYDKAVAALPGDPAVHFDRGTALAALSRFDEAAEEFLHATEAKDPSLKEAAFYNLGNAFFKKDKFKEATEAYKRALALDPKDARAKWNLEIALKKKREDDQKKEQDKNKKDDQNKKDENKKDKDQDKDQKKDDKQQEKDKQEKDKQDKDKQDKQDEKNKKSEPPPPEKPEDKSAAEREIESVLDGLEKSPKDLEKQRARLRAVRRAPPTRDW